MNMCANHPEVPATAYCRSCGKPLCESCRIDSLGAVYCSAHAPQSARPAAPPVSSQPVAPPPTVATDAAGAAAPVRPGSFAASAYTTAASAAGQSAPPYKTNFPSGSIASNVSGLAPQSVPVSPYAQPVEHPSASPFVALMLGTIPGVGAIYNGQYAKGLIHAIIFGLLITVISNNENGPLAPLIGILIAVWWFYMVLEAYHTARQRRKGLPLDEFSSILHIHRGQRGLPLGAIVLISLGVLLLLNTSGLLSISRLIRYWPISLIVLGLYMLYNRIENRTQIRTREARNESR